MSDPFIGEIRMVGFNFEPSGWALCNGQLLSISQHQALYALLGTTYGGDGRSTFGVPDLRGRVPIHQGQQGPATSRYAMGQSGGAETVALTPPQLPPHAHTLAAQGAAGSAATPIGNYPAASVDSTGKPLNAFSPSPGGVMSAGAIGPSGGGQAHPNLQPYLCVNFIIALQGMFPTRD